MFYPLIVGRTGAFFILAAALFLVLFVFRPHAVNRIFMLMAREEDITKGILIGPLVYISSVVVCVALYPVFISATSIGVMAFGDGFATLVGKRWGRHHTPLDRNKTYEGSVAFVVFAFIATFLAMTITAPLASYGDIALLALAGAVSGAVVEMLPFSEHRGSNIFQRLIIDDNFFVPIIAGLAIYSTYVYLI